MRVVSGIQPSGRLHLGNYYGAVRQFLRLQDEATDSLYFIADLHALTTNRSGELMRRRSLDLALDLLAVGLDPAKAVLFRQSDVPEIPMLAWILGSVTPLGLLERGHAYKDKVARGRGADLALFTYPVLMAADILLYDADAVPVGQDQKQHIEMARDIATKFNTAYVTGYDPQDPRGERGGTPGVFRLPAPLILAHATVVPGLDGHKMSKSYGNTLDIFAPEDAVHKAFMSIKTDATAVADPKPIPHLLLSFLELLTDPEEYQHHLATWGSGGVGYRTYKGRLIERFHEIFGSARLRRAELERDVQGVLKILRDGAERARALAAPMWDKVVAKTGVGDGQMHLS